MSEPGDLRITIESERATVAESTKKLERAIHGERTNFNERARVAEVTMRDERANELESTICSERAMLRGEHHETGAIKICNLNQSKN
jgi:hypothetical protein